MADIELVEVEMREAALDAAVEAHRADPSPENLASVKQTQLDLVAARSAYRTQEAQAGRRNAFVTTQDHQE